jgi:hypothetical protein
VEDLGPGLINLRCLKLCPLMPRLLKSRMNSMIDGQTERLIAVRGARQQSSVGCGYCVQHTRGRAVSGLSG